MNSPLLPCPIQPVSAALSLPFPVDVLRLDLLHSVVSGNKWFKLKWYLAEAKTLGKTSLLTFGGAFSNHIVATAAAAQQQGLTSIGIIRGEEPQTLSHTLLAARQYGMQLYFVARESYREKLIPSVVFDQHKASEIYTIPEGGYGRLGAQGAEEILPLHETAAYTHILGAVGTGTTLAGLVSAALPHQKIIGIPVLKNAFSLQTEIEALLPSQKKSVFDLQWNYHFDGYAKHTAELISFMNSFYTATGIPTDFVYTGKAFFAAMDLIQKNHFSPDSRLLLVHTGGLQGNASLGKGTLIFEG